LAAQAGDECLGFVVPSQHLVLELGALALNARRPLVVILFELGGAEVHAADGANHPNIAQIMLGKLSKKKLKQKFKWVALRALEGNRGEELESEIASAT
jgi:hypothetical protein